MILVTGATGNVGAEVVQALGRAGEPVRALVRRPADVPAEQVVGDLDDPDSLAPALDGVRGVFLLPGHRDMPGLLDRMRRAGVERVVLLSSLATVATDTRNVLSEYMIGSETAVRESGLAWTFLRPNAFMSNALRWLPQLRAGDVVRDAFGTVPVASVDPYDIAAVAVRALLDPGHEERVHPLSGPEPLLPAQRLAVLPRSSAATCASTPSRTRRAGPTWPRRACRSRTSRRSSASTETAPSTSPRSTRPSSR
ncbi:SDR family oxidoreductase [Streptomyces sp. NK15101]|uniref:SDR family oxidoreductase n=1 Tax=Streptomyces sp. NK15101 TaxID=2873261 RepID=UPI001CEC786B|nr:NAD(P)H-binding protein [Streptomyces sp. NK15101]